MSCFLVILEFFFWVVVVVEEGGGLGFLPTIVGYATRGARKKTHQIIGGGGGGLPKIEREKN